MRAALNRSAGEYYEDLDVDLARRAGTALWTLASVYTAAVLATRTIVPAIGWLLAVVLVSGVLAMRLRAGRDHPSPISGRDLLWATFGGIALVALAQWLGDGELALTNGLLSRPSSLRRRSRRGGRHSCWSPLGCWPRLR